MGGWPPSGRGQSAQQVTEVGAGGLQAIFLGLGEGTCTSPWAVSPPLDDPPPPHLSQPANQ